MPHNHHLVNDDDHNHRHPHQQRLRMVTLTIHNNLDHHRLVGRAKKARRRDLEQRREMQRQRQAAADMGFQAEGAAVGQNNQEAMALQHLLQEQINAMEAVAADNDEPEDEARE
mmetsp:Transcript_26775/g.56062  ORF Transcript_26775/g.56062 Transcript_26775/m.56062 type:complete len:114 (-) Transcript_26775:894-1235(-)